MTRLNQSGSHIVALVLGIAVIGVIGFAGYTVSQRQKTDTSTNDTTTATAVPAAIKTKADLQQASKALDTASTQVNSSVDGSALDGDINDLL